MGFAPDWLGLRAPADDAGRNPALLARAATCAGGHIVDLGAGTGATPRAMAGAVGDHVTWTLVDNDPALLALAPRLGGRVTPLQADLTDLDAVPLAQAGLVTASALLDLVSEDWLDKLVGRLARHEKPFYAALSYNGDMHWTPALDDDASVTEAFNQDQRSDKGFGPALGPDAARIAAERFHAAGFTVVTGDSPWSLGSGQHDLQVHLLQGIAAAAARAGHASAEHWGRDRIARIPTARAHIGHTDLLAVPPDWRRHE